MEMLTQDRSSKIQKRSSKTTEFKILSPDGENMGMLKVKADAPACEEKSLLASLNMMIAHSSGQDKTSKAQMLMLREAFRRNKITCEEAIESFWKAYSDPYVSQGRIEFRHLWKHIEVMRKGEGRRAYSYEEMLMDMQKRGITTDSYSMISEEDSKGRPKWVLK